MKPLSKDLEETPAIIVKPKIESQKYSGLLNCIASSARNGEKKYREIQLNKPPQNEAKHATAKALAAWPFLVNSYPSIAVAAEAGVPGV